MKGIDTLWIAVRNMAAQSSFYAGFLEREPVFQSKHWTAFDLGGVRLGLHLSDLQAPAQGGWVPSFEVENLDQTTARLAGLGVQLSAPHPTPRGTLREGKDPEGNAFQVFEVDK